MDSASNDILAQYSKGEIDYLSAIEALVVLGWTTLDAETAVCAIDDGE